MSPRRKRRRVKVNLRSILLVFLIGGMGFLAWWSWATKPYASTGSSEKITVVSGTTVEELAAELKERRLIRSAWAFQRVFRGQNEEPTLYAGDYYLTPAMSPKEMVLYLLDAESVNICRVTIPEGYNTEQIIDLFVQKGIGSKEEFTRVIMEDQFEYDFLDDAPEGIHRLEGYLFPNTYDIDQRTSPHAVIDMLIQQFVKELTPEVENQLAAKKLTISEWVTLGSLVEKEAQKELDRPLIASVFMNRLKVNQPLQSCATIQFLLETPKEKLYNKDLQIPSPYNTYLHAGLPPGPIANPGHASLQAALQPAKTEYLYFVAKGDGFHAFSKTYAEHLKNIERYQ